MFKRITLNVNRDELARKALVWGGITLGFIASSLVTTKKPSVVIVEETVTETAPEPEAPKAEEK